MQTPKAREPALAPVGPKPRIKPFDAMMDDFVSESESDYTSYWRDWVRISVPSAPAALSERKDGFELHRDSRPEDGGGLDAKR